MFCTKSRAASAFPVWEGACPDDGMSVDTSVIDPPPSGASPLPQVDLHFDREVFHGAKKRPEQVGA